MAVIYFGITLVLLPSNICGGRENYDSQTEETPGFSIFCLVGVPFRPRVENFARLRCGLAALRFTF